MCLLFRPLSIDRETVEVCITHSLVRIFHNHQEITLHERATKKWEYKRKSEHAPPFPRSSSPMHSGRPTWLAANIGSFTHQVQLEFLSHPTVDKLKPVRHLLRLSEKYSKERLEKACERAFNCKLFAYTNVKNILDNNLDTKPTRYPAESKNNRTSQPIDMQETRFL